jgi:phenylalanyl-tRNA synthetase alpha chain
MNERISELRAAGEAAIAEAPGTTELEDVRVRFLGRKAELPNLLRGVAQLPPEERGTVGRAANEARKALEAAIEARAHELEAAELDSRLAADVIDVTLPGSPAVKPGRVHLLTQTRREIEDIFLGLGFRVMEGPETELVYYNFDALNFDETHPSRQATDTFYISDDVLLRVHTSPMQTRAMEMYPPPLYVVIPGRTYRRDNDATHTPQFNQVEGLAVDEDVTLGDLQGTLLAFAQAYFGEDRRVRLRPHFFPFTEPSAEMDIRCDRSGGEIKVGEGNDWLEILGCGMVHPNVLKNCGLDPDEYQGFAFGLGVDRLAMLKYGMPDLRPYFEADVDWIRHYGFKPWLLPTVTGGLS